MSKYLNWITRVLFGSATPPGVWANVGLLLLRLHVGLAMASGGLDKLLPVPDWFVDQVSGIGFPMPAFFAFAASMAEFAGGILLALGLFTRTSALFLAITIGVAAFGFHEVTPIRQLHITQVLFWSYVLFTFAGGGRYALDRFVRRKSAERSADQPVLSKGGVLFASVVAVAVAATGTYHQLVTPEPRPPSAVEENFQPNSISLAGTFNDWDLEASPMSLQKDGRWITTIAVPSPGAIEFKFAANGTWDINCGEVDQESDELPLVGVGEINDGADPQNIRAFVPMAGDYEFAIDPRDYTYSLTKAQVTVEDPQYLLGKWQVDLRPTPGAESYFQTLVVETVEGNTLTGSFYNTDIQRGKIDAQWGAVQFTFVTGDGTGDYYTSGKLVNGRLEGTTHSPSRELFSVWKATRLDIE